MTNLIELTHTERPAWSLSDERVPVFTVRRPNPTYDEAHAEWEHQRDEYRREQPEMGDEQTPPFALPEPEAELVTTYTMPAKTNPGLALDYLRRARENADVAASWLLELAIGTQGYDALVEELSGMDDPDAASALMQDIIVTVAKRALGGLGKA